jgi:hypothetical protein
MSEANELNILSGSPLEFRRRPMLISGQIRKGEDSFLVLVNSEDSKHEQTITLWHEIVHLIKHAGGQPPQSQDEDEVEAAARKLAECCPEILQWAFYEENNKGQT